MRQLETAATAPAPITTKLAPAAGLQAAPAAGLASYLRLGGRLLALGGWVTALALGGTAQAATTVFRSVDAQGNPVFSDTPPDQRVPSETILLDDPNTFTQPARALPGDDGRTWDWRPDDTDDEAADFAYHTLSILSPTDDETVRENAGNVTVVATIDPDLRPGHRVEVLLDGQIVASGTSTTVSLTALDRGTHALMVRIIDDAGETLLSSPTSTFHLLRYAPLLAPNRPATPRN